MAYDEQPIPGLEVEVKSKPTQTLLVGALAISCVLLVASGTLELLSWPVVILGVGSLVATIVNGSHWFALGGGALFAVMALVFRLSAAGGTDYAERTASQDPPPTVEEAAATESLGLTVSEVAEHWNALGHPPSITRGLIRDSASGPYDSFSYRFDSAASLAGAFDPADDSVHALLLTAGLGHGSAQYFYLHLCFMLHPYSQECIDAYLEEGLGGEELAEYVGAQHIASWEIGDQLWELEISGDVQTIRVLGNSVR